MDFATGFATGFAMGKKMFEGGGGGSDEWTFPSHWLDIPDPEPNQVIMYVEADAGDVAPIIGLYGANYDGGTINYGDDGYTYDYPSGYGYNVYHVYQTAGQYIITITAAGNEVYLNALGTNVAFMVGHIYEGSYGGYNSSENYCRCIRAIKVGSDISLYAHDTRPFDSGRYGRMLVYSEFMGAVNGIVTTFSGLRALKKIKIGTPPEAFKDDAFSGCNSLEIADCLQNLKAIPSNMFAGCYALRSAEFPEAVSVGSDAFHVCYSLKTVNAPKLAEITSDEFSSCYSLQSLTLADGCNLNGNKFENCPQLYPKPQ